MPRTRVRAQSTNRAPALLGPPMSTLPGAVWGSVHRPGASIHSSTTAHTMRVAPQMTSTSPVSVAPDTIWSHRASTVPPASTASLPVTVPAGDPMGTTTGSWSSATPTAFSTSASHPAPRRSDPMHRPAPVSMAGTPPMA